MALVAANEPRVPGAAALVVGTDAIRRSGFPRAIAGVFNQLDLETQRVQMKEATTAQC